MPPGPAKSTPRSALDVPREFVGGKNDFIRIGERRESDGVRRASVYVSGEYVGDIARNVVHYGSKWRTTGVLARVFGQVPTNGAPDLYAVLEWLDALLRDHSIPPEQKAPHAISFKTSASLRSTDSGSFNYGVNVFVDGNATVNDLDIDMPPHSPRDRKLLRNVKSIRYSAHSILSATKTMLNVVACDSSLEKCFRNFWRNAPM